MRRMVVGAIGARTTPFKTVRIDELALQRHGITVETLDLAEVIGRVKALRKNDAFIETAALMRASASWDGVPEAAFENIVKLGVVLDEITGEYQLDALAIRCWLELQEQLGISPCVALSVLNDKGTAAACEVDLGSAIAMHALRLASGKASTCLDWNNNFGDGDDRCALFHCGPVSNSLMRERGRVGEQEILKSSVEPGCTWGCSLGRLAPFDFTFGNLTAEDGRLRWYLGNGTITEDELPADFFGCGGVAEIERLQGVLLHVMRNGHHHHVSLTPGLHCLPLKEALNHYLGHEVALPQSEA
jgi:L-fucose isomerase-like protein